MGIVRNSATRILAPYDRGVYLAILAAFHSAGIKVSRPGNPIVGESKRSLRKNRWATVTAAVRPETPTTTVVDWSVDTLGGNHGEVITEILDATNFPIDDLGVGDALARLGKSRGVFGRFEAPTLAEFVFLDEIELAQNVYMGRLFGRPEAHALAACVHLDERVIELAHGVYGGHQGLLVLTTQRLFFFDKKSLMGARVEEFAFSAISSLGFSKKVGGEAIDISISGRSAEISQIAPGRAETFIAAFRHVRSGSAAANAPAVQQGRTGGRLGRSDP